eukprot:UN27558
MVPTYSWSFWVVSILTLILESLLILMFAYMFLADEAETLYDRWENKKSDTACGKYYNETECRENDCSWGGDEPDVCGEMTTKDFVNDNHDWLMGRVTMWFFLIACAFFTAALVEEIGKYILIRI